MSQVGLEKLTEYLNQTRRQAELSIDVLTEKISTLSNENEDLKTTIEALVYEKSQYKEVAERLKMENSKKWKFQERDDWKCLVDSVQADRNRLQDENSNLVQFLQLEKEKVQLLEQEIGSLTIEIENLRRQLVEGSNSKSSDNNSNRLCMNGLSTPLKSLNISTTDGFYSCEDPSGSDTFDTDSSHLHQQLSDSPDQIMKLMQQKQQKLQQLTPRAATSALHFELDKVQRKLTYERKVARGEINAQTEEIKSLRRQLNLIITTRLQQPIPVEFLDHSHDEGNDDDDVSKSLKSSSNSSLFSWNGMFWFLFPQNSSGSSGLKAIDFQQTKIMHV